MDDSGLRSIRAKRHLARTEARVVSPKRSKALVVFYLHLFQ